MMSLRRSPQGNAAPLTRLKCCDGNIWIMVGDGETELAYVGADVNEECIDAPFSDEALGQNLGARFARSTDDDREV